jgi:NTP pyrophosphatase (non-canonical NTP hydrolase)
MEEVPITISGSFQKALDLIRLDIIEFQKLGCVILSPRTFLSHRNDDGFVILDSDGNKKPAAIHGHHLLSISQSKFLWVRNPNGYIGPSTGLEIGYATAMTIPIFASNEASDASLSRFLKIAKNPEIACDYFHKLRRNPVNKSYNIQIAVSHMASQCGFDSEKDVEIIEFLCTEIEELKEALDKKTVQDGPHNISDEIADCAIYIYHLANQNGINLDHAINKKILINLERWARKRKSA